MVSPGALWLTGCRNAGMLPKMISSTSGNPTPQIGPTRSRPNSLSSVSVSRPSAEAESRRDATSDTCAITRRSWFSGIPRRLAARCLSTPSSVASGASYPHRPRGQATAANV
jgi:hypothetical protein